ncbi:MAG: GntR family transcriptional regulator, partial [Candidatus Eremiobacteraeota bacterium]|nr:GntR family transcriptional regulator [Candidatus Eremiobacteraeota bacterium]
MTPAIALDTRDPRPLYVQIADALATAIERGELAAEERLPPIRTLAGDLDVALVTVSQAYETL